ncbi:MASE1 domain-containing protein [Rheinheimera sp. 1928-s]|uniref:MASE1 domain-containing protein n=1 Tax=Rheinheimera sp. 1928-s TaxID=3033803 RepID=UPI002623A228|nr:MASE1 domain-containing protein [Rheinheimera sp. 1928-s]MDF3124669.1 MASE1 domain-containing protein [Rheinheimera sp. 1928-s]
MKKEFLDTSNSLSLLTKHIALLFGYAMVYLGLYALSKNFFTHQGWSTWYMPNGFRLAMLLILPWRYWSTIFVTEFFCQRSITLYYGNVPAEFWYSFLRGMATRTLCALPVIWIKHHFQTAALHKLKFGLMLLAATFAFSIVSATDLVLLSKFYQNIPAERKLEVWLSFVTGGCIGILLVCPLLLAVYQLTTQKVFQAIHSKLWLHSALLAASGIVAYVVFQSEPASLYLLASLSLIPALYESFRHGWLGAVFSLTLINLFLGLSLYGSSGTLTMQQIQVLVLLINITTLLFGAAVSEQHELTAELRAKNTALTELANRNLKLAEKFSTLQENERKHLSNELHDELGQTVTALKMEAMALSRSKDQQMFKDNLPRLTKAVDHIYEAVYRLMNQLRPRLLEELGLVNALTTGQLPSMLKNANIHYITDISPLVLQLPQELQTTLFRACQEGITNVVKHSNASTCKLQINVIEDNAELLLTDNGTIKATAQSGKFGLQGIKDRVMAYGGTFRFMSGSEGTSISVRLPLTLKPD